ncbi:MAG: hypothetical protein ABSG26_10970 [Bryobacteraceae bacterium]
MSVLRPLCVCILSVLPSWGATFGTVVPHTQPIADLVLDAARKRIYLVDTYSSQVDVYNTASNPPTLLTTINTSATPLAIAMSRSGKSLYVACYTASTLDIIDLTSATFSKTSVSLGANPEGVAVGSNELVLISTIGTGTGQAVLTTYNPSASASSALQAIVVAPSAPTTPQMPPPNGLMYFASKSQLQATLDGSQIIGVNQTASTRTVFVFDVASSTVLASRTISGISPILAVSPDGSEFLSGSVLFETATLLVLAQQSAANSPFVFPAAANFTTQTNQGGAAFLPDGSELLTSYNIVPVQSPAAKANTSQLLINTPDSLLIQLGVMLPENLGGKIVMSSDGTTMYAISQSGFLVAATAGLKTSPIAIPDTNVALLANDQCGVTAAQNSAVIPVRDQGGGKLTVTAQVLTSASTSAQVRVAAKSYGGDVTAQYNTAVTARGLGTVAPDQLLIQSSEAINIIPNVRVFQNNRNAEARGTVIPVDTGASTTGLADMLADTARQRLYIANPGLNRIEIFDMKKQQFLAPITVGQLPRSIAFGGDGNTLYAANSGSEYLSVVDLTKGAVIGKVRLPPIPLNASFALLTPSVIASSQRGPQVLMSDGTLWMVVGATMVPRTLNTDVFGTVRAIPAPQTMASSPEGSFVLLLAGNGSAYLYSAAADDFVAARLVIPTPIQGYYGPIAVGPGGQYYLVNNQVLNQALTPIGTATAASRPVAAVAAVDAQSFVRFSTPASASATAVAADAGLIEVVNATSQQTTAAANALEGPLTAVTGTQRANINGRTMAIDPSGATVYVLTASGLQIIPFDTTGTQYIPQAPANGVVNTANYLPSVASGGLVSIFGLRLASAASAGGAPLPTVLGGTCVTLNNTPLPLLASFPNQINAQLPPTLAAGRYPLVVRSIANHEASSSATVAVSKYAPAVFVDADGPAIFHQDGTRLDRYHPGQRDEPLTIYATGLGPTTGGKVTAGVPAPLSPLAVTGPVQVFFGDPTISDAQEIVDWSGLAPGLIGVYQINCRIPGTHLKGDALPVTLRIGGVSSSVTGPTTPTVYVE